MRRPSPVARARAVVVAGAGSVTAGVWLAAGDAAALVTGGVAAVLYGLLFMDVDRREASS